jgi:hypothetical protein
VPFALIVERGFGEVMCIGGLRATHCVGVSASQRRASQPPTPVTNDATPRRRCANGVDAKGGKKARGESRGGACRGQRDEGVSSWSSYPAKAYPRSTSSCSPLPALRSVRHAVPLARSRVSLSMFSFQMYTHAHAGVWTQEILMPYHLIPFPTTTRASPRSRSTLPLLWTVET